LRENAEIEFANGNFVSTSINLKNKSAGDGCRDKTIEKTILRAFRAPTFSRSQGQSRRFHDVRVTSAFHPIAVVQRTSPDFAFVPRSDTRTGILHRRKPEQLKGLKILQIS
jgi:hypothetical protein